MAYIPDEVKSLFTASLLGRLKLKLYKKMTGRKDFLPEDRCFTRYLFQQYRINAQSGVLFTHILSQTSAACLDYSKAEKEPDVGKLLSKLEKNPLKGSAFIEITNCPSPLPSTLGACTHCQKLSDGSYVYFITLLDENTFPDFLVSRVEILTDEEQTNLLSNVLTASGFEQFHFNDIQWRLSQVPVGAVKGHDPRRADSEQSHDKAGHLCIRHLKESKETLRSFVVRLSFGASHEDISYLREVDCTNLNQGDDKASQKVDACSIPRYILVKRALQEAHVGHCARVLSSFIWR
jgi:hypothetical protein